MVKAMIKKNILGTLVASSVLMSACVGGSSSSNTPPTQTSMVVATVSGGTHTLNGTYTSACYSPDGSNGQVDSAEITGSQWMNIVKFYTGDPSCTVAPDVSTLTGTLTESIQGNVALSGWNYSIPTAADGSGPLSANETVTLMDLEITAITGTYFSVPIGYTTPTFYVVDDTASPSITLYRDDIVDTVTPNYTASSADPLMQ
jgi:hypothetical protein